MTTYQDSFTVRDESFNSLGEFERVHSPLPWQISGLRETASGYGKKLTSQWKVRFNGKLYRVYITSYSNSGTAWFKAGGTVYTVS